MEHRGLEASSNSGAMVRFPQITGPLETGERRHHQSHQSVEKHVTKSPGLETEVPAQLLNVTVSR